MFCIKFSFQHVIYNGPALKNPCK